MSASTISDNAPLDPDDELLVAYLDGELQRQEQSDLEDRLLTNEKLRSRLQQLQTGWDLLEDLPGSSPSMKLVESTLELVVADILKDQPTEETKSSRWQLPLCLLLLCLICMITESNDVFLAEESPFPILSGKREFSLSLSWDSLALSWRPRALSSASLGLPSLPP